MGGTFSSEKKGVMATQSVTSNPALRDLHVVQIRNKVSGSYVIPQSPANASVGFDRRDMKNFYNGQPLMFKRELKPEDLGISYFVVSSSGVFRHFFTELIIASESDSIENGRPLALREGLPTDMRFAFTLEKDNKLRHNSTGLCVQPEGNSSHTGAKLFCYPHSVKDVAAAAEIQFLFSPVPLDELHKAVERKQADDRELMFSTSADGQSQRAAELAGSASTGEVERTSVEYITNANYAKVNIGVNKLAIATSITDGPTYHISCSPQGVACLSKDEVDEQQTWSFVELNPTKLNTHDDSIEGRAIRICNKTGAYLCVNSSGTICTNNQDGSVWNVMQARDKNLVYFVNDRFPFALKQDEDKLTAVPKTSQPDKSMRWKVYHP